MKFQSQQVVNKNTVDEWYAAMQRFAEFRIDDLAANTYYGLDVAGAVGLREMSTLFIEGWCIESTAVLIGDDLLVIVSVSQIDFSKSGLDTVKEDGVVTGAPFIHYRFPGNSDHHNEFIRTLPVLLDYSV